MRLREARGKAIRDYNAAQVAFAAMEQIDPRDTPGKLVKLAREYATQYAAEQGRLAPERLLFTVHVQLPWDAEWDVLYTAIMPPRSRHSPVFIGYFTAFRYRRATMPTDKRFTEHSLSVAKTIYNRYVGTNEQMREYAKHTITQHFRTPSWAYVITSEVLKGGKQFSSATVEVTTASPLEDET